MEFLADFLVEFPVESIIQELVSEEAWEEELWDLEENRLSQVPDFWERLEQVLEDLEVLAPGQVSPMLQGQVVFWCLGEEQGLQQLIKPRPKLGLGLEALAEFQGVLELVEFLGLLELAEFLGLSVVLVASVA
ncbi:hypothetical protein P7L94_23780 [Vibrio parahaemolyticus]|nr:hypothetical protein [Vibrio parahaemolyticus]